jgi:hypothetical protein
MKWKKQPALACPIDFIGASAQAFSGFCGSHEPPPSSNERSIVMLHRDSHQNSQQNGYISHCRFVDFCPGGHRGDTERVVT